MSATRKKLDEQLKRILNDTGFQRGLSWRGEKVKAVAIARRRGIPDEEIFRQLKIAGLMDTTAKKIMNDAYYFESPEITEKKSKEHATENSENTSFMDYAREKQKNDQTTN